MARQLGRLGRAGVGVGRWARRVLGERELGRVTRRRAAGGRTCWARGMSGRRVRGDTAMLACDTAEGLLRHGASARSARGHARPGRGLGVGWVCWLGQLGQVGALCTWLSFDSVFGPGSTRYFPESLNEHCSL